MELIEVLHMIGQQGQQASQPTDLVIGTVSAVDPLEIQTDGQTAPLMAAVLILTAAVVEKKISILEHNHTIPTGGNTGDSLTDIACLENGTALPVEDGYIILNRALAVGDKVIMLKTQRGQRYIILSRVY